MTQGTLSDRFGRKRPLIVATAIYTVACLGCALAPSVQWLATFRALSALGASAGMVIPRAMVRDLAEGHAAAVLLSRLSLVMGAAPILAPTVGSAVLAFADWRGIFWILTAYGATCWLLVVLLLPDTLPEGRRIRLRLGEQLHRYRSILNERGFITHAAMGAFATFAFFAYLGGSSPVFIQGFGLSPAQYAMIFGANSFGLICCAQLNPHLLRRFGHSRVLHGAARVHLAATAALAVIAFAGWHTLPLIVAPVFVAISCMGILNPNTIVGALARHGGADAGRLHRRGNRRRIQTACIAPLVPPRIDPAYAAPPIDRDDACHVALAHHWSYCPVRTRRLWRSPSGEGRELHRVTATADRGDHAICRGACRRVGAAPVAAAVNSVTVG